MEYKKKKNKTVIIISTFIFAFIISLSIKVKDAKALKSCTITQELYVNLALELDANGNVAYVKAPDFTTSYDNIPEGAVNVHIPTTPTYGRSFTEQDCRNYINTLEERVSQGHSIDEGFCWTGNDGVEHCVNSGAGNGFVDPIVATNHGENCSGYLNSMVDTETYVRATGETDERGNPKIEVVRTDEFNITQEMLNSAILNPENNLYYLSVASVIELTYTYDAENCKDPDGGGNNGNSCVDNTDASATLSGCENGGAAQTVRMDLVTDWYNSSPEFEEEIRDTAICGGDVSEMAEAQGNANQNGHFTTGNFTNIYSGGGIELSFNYNTTAIWNYCNGNRQQSASKGAKCTRRWLKPTCSSSDYAFNYATGQCEKNIPGYCAQYAPDGVTCINYVPSQTLTEPVQCEYTSSGGYQSEGKCGGGGSKAEEMLAIEASEHISELDTTKAESYDSDEYPAKKVDIVNGKHAGYFNENNASAGSWPRGTQIAGSINYVRNESCINLYQPFNITYGNACNPENQISGRRKYFVPIKWPEEDPFKFWITNANVSIIKNMNWQLDIDCGVNCEQRIYEDPKHNDFSYKFIYRPINLSDPFPNRNAGKNWTYFMNSEEAKTTELKRDRLEYHAFFTKADISNLKASITSNRNYSDLRTIQPNGYSNELGNMISNGYNIEKVNAEYDALGKCTGKWCVIQ